ncbi:Hypothetical predicted protein [Xyrichtys novacula]|uniref:Uncharacterized protein n=1 Tax=Xyrichtys novacula TaxID=13765 RepID=A0AAV1FEW3_XYRNO|nr:Hypothetical predicted protein [Xyrichtys novacula]
MNLPHGSSSCCPHIKVSDLLEFQRPGGARAAQPGSLPADERRTLRKRSAAHRGLPAAALPKTTKVIGGPNDKPHSSPPSLRPEKQRGCWVKEDEDGMFHLTLEFVLLVCEKV